MNLKEKKGLVDEVVVQRAGMKSVCIAEMYALGKDEIRAAPAYCKQSMVLNIKGVTFKLYKGQCYYIPETVIKGLNNFIPKREYEKRIRY
ncbi:hypothetical protein [Ekhidna sp.]|uniref:hypothetical protein n=1 Tax=Ekhidna sp. TaxID=2608089 RepID=UPI003BAD14DA